MVAETDPPTGTRRMVGLMVAVKPGATVVLRVTVPVKLSTLETMMVLVEQAPGKMVRLEGVVVIVKSGVGSAAEFR